MKVNVIMDEDDFKRIVLILNETDSFGKNFGNLRLQNAWRVKGKMLERILKQNHYEIVDGKRGKTLRKCQNNSGT